MGDTPPGRPPVDAAAPAATAGAPSASATGAQAGDDIQGAILEVRDLSLQFGGLKALRDVSFQVARGELFSIIGPNGAGKTSTLNCISGRYRPSAGQILYKGRDLGSLSINARADLGIGRTFQNLALFGHMTVLENILVGRHHLMRSSWLKGALYWAWPFGASAEAEEIEHRRAIEDIIDFLEISHVRHATAGALSYGLRKRVELARAIALRPDLILLDEPMAGMNLEEKEDMARFVIDLNEEWGMTVIMIEHDMSVVMDISNRVMVLDFGACIAHGTAAQVLADARVRQAYLGEDLEAAGGAGGGDRAATAAGSGASPTRALAEA